jgi:hypothetical protein
VADLLAEEPERAAGGVEGASVGGAGDARRRGDEHEVAALGVERGDPVTKYPSVQDNVRRRAGAPESIDFASDAWGAKQAGGRDEMTNAVHFWSVDPVGGRRAARR